MLGHVAFEYQDSIVLSLLRSRLAKEKHQFTEHVVSKGEADVPIHEELFINHHTGLKALERLSKHVVLLKRNGEFVPSYDVLDEHLALN